MIFFFRNLRVYYNIIHVFVKSLKKYTILQDQASTISYSVLTGLTLYFVVNRRLRTAFAKGFRRFFLSSGTRETDGIGVHFCVAVSPSIFIQKRLRKKKKKSIKQTKRTQSHIARAHSHDIIIL